MKEWHVKMKLSGIDMRIPVIARDKQQAKCKAIMYATQRGYRGHKVYNVTEVK